MAEMPPLQGLVAFLASMPLSLNMESVNTIACNGGTVLPHLTTEVNCVFVPDYTDTCHDHYSTYLRALSRSPNVVRAIARDIPILLVSSLPSLIEQRDFSHESLKNSGYLALPLQFQRCVTDSLLVPLMGGVISETMDQNTTLVVASDTTQYPITGYFKLKPDTILLATSYLENVCLIGKFSTADIAKYTLQLHHPVHLDLKTEYLGMSQLVKSVEMTNQLRDIRVFPAPSLSKNIVEMLNQGSTLVSSVEEAEFICGIIPPALERQHSAKFVTPYWFLASAAIGHPLCRKLFPFFYSLPMGTVPFQHACLFGIGNRPFLRLIVIMLLISMGVEVSFSFHTDPDKTPDVAICCCPLEKIRGKRKRFLQRALSYDIPVVSIDYIANVYRSDIPFSSSQGQILFSTSPSTTSCGSVSPNGITASMSASSLDDPAPVYDL